MRSIKTAPDFHTSLRECDSVFMDKAKEEQPHEHLGQVAASFLLVLVPPRMGD